MAVTLMSGPIGVVGAVPGNSGDSNQTPGPSFFAHGFSLADQRFMPPGGGGDVTAILPQFYGTDGICVCDAVPTTLAAANISAAAVPVAGTALTLAGASTGITVIGAAGFQLSPMMGLFPANARVMEGNPALIQIGTLGGGVSMYDPRTMLTRCLRFTSVGNDSTATAAVVGLDWYGQLVHETVTLANATVATSKKALKAVISITPAGTLSGSNLSVGTSDVYGFGLASSEFFGFVTIFWNNTLISANTGYTAAVASTATATTGDVRGTYGVQSASDGTKRLTMFVAPTPWNVTSAGLFGVTQF